MKKNLLFSSVFVILIAATLFFGLFAYNQLTQLNGEIREKFDGRKWSVPAVVYARPLEIFPGMKLKPDMFESELELSGYRLEDTIQSAGGYRRDNNYFQVITRKFIFPDGVEESHKVTVHFGNDAVTKITSIKTGEHLPFLRLDPVRIGSFHPLEHEDRIVLTADEIPEILSGTIIAVEDRNFPTHHGVSITGIARALIANLKAGKTVQGGSTITQQLVKNLFLNRERTLSRKLQEAVMALLLEYHYSKEDILTAYINEIFLGQDGARAIHGFALASQFYFRRDLQDLSAAQIATLVGMVKGPSAYDPRRYPKQCLARRQTVLEQMVARHVIDQATFGKERHLPITDVHPQKNGFNRFPAFLDLVRRQLKEEYDEKDLNTNGLKILTTLDPLVQLQVEQVLDGSITDLEKLYRQDNIEGAIVVSGRENGEIEALSGGRKARKAGFNRALDARRPIGSLVKPAVYLTALANGYTLASPLSDTSITLDSEGKTWRPENYDKKEHGRVPLYLALAKSYNLATVHLGMNVGLQNVLKTIRLLGYTEPLTPFPSLLLGAVSMSPLQVAQMYQTVASGGFHQPLRSIRAVMDEKGNLLTRYGIEIEQRFQPKHMYLLSHGLQRVMTEGTGKRMNLPNELHLAGKTGTSDGLRDSWFAGYTGQRVAVVWLGRDDNTSTSLTGSTGALKIWSSIMQRLDPAPLEIPEPAEIRWKRIDTRTLRTTHILNSQNTRLPFIADSEPVAQRKNTRSRHELPTIEIDLQEIENEARQVIDALGDLFK